MMAKIGISLVVLLIVMAMLFLRFKTNNEVVSGIVYNTTNDSLLAGNTKFSVRASENTYVSEENQSSYCLPPNSPYKELVNKAAENKNIKVIVTKTKFIALQAPWTCRDNVKVMEVQ